MSPEEIAAGIEAFVRERFAVAPTDGAFGRAVDLFEEGYVDSIGVLETIDFLERSYRVEIRERDLLSEEFATIAGMAAIVAARLTPDS